VYGVSKGRGKKEERFFFFLLGNVDGGVLRYKSIKVRNGRGLEQNEEKLKTPAKQTKRNANVPTRFGTARYFHSVITSRVNRIRVIRAALFVAKTFGRVTETAPTFL